MPVVTAVQLVPLFVDRNTPPSVPVKKFESLTARDSIIVFVKPLLAAVQLVPLLVERNTPLLVAANRFESLTASENTRVFVKPVLTENQLIPLLVDRKTPPPQVPAKRLAPFKAKPWTCPPYSPLVCVHWAMDGWMVQIQKAITNRNWKSVS